MPTNRMRRKRVRDTMTDEQRAWLYAVTGNETEGMWIFFTDDDELRALWERNRQDVMSWWVENRPCTRPLRWWTYDAPRQPDQGSGCFWEGTLPVPRRRIGGIGTPCHEVLNHVPSYRRGMPCYWVRLEDIDENGRGVAIDPNNPPTFESEASYLQRHDLLMRSELQYLEKHPELLEPEKIVITENY